MYLLFWFRNLKTPIVLYHRCMANGLRWPKIIPKIHKEPETTKILISYIELQYLLDCDYLRQYEVGITGFFFYYYLFYMESHVIGQCHCHWRIPVDILSHFDKIVEQYNNLEQVERTTCKNVFVVVALGAYTLFLFYFFAPLIFNRRRAKAKVLFRKKRHS